MGEVKTVKVDNWGVFFLQKLQNFFNKTDYCDLTLQFQDNSQLKVHRLVMSACTDYFNVLEQSCDIVDDAIIMPTELQAEVVVPIVNFMYTGTLEFELKMYNRLLRTAREMNMTVLLKLLEAHRRTMEMHPQKNQAPTSPKLRRRGVVQSSTNKGVLGSMHTKIGGSTSVNSSTPNVQRRVISVGSSIPGNTNRSVGGQNSTMGSQSVRYGSTSAFTRVKQEMVEKGSNTSRQEYVTIKRVSQQQTTATSPFEQLRKGYNNIKRPATATYVSPPSKKPNLEDVKEFAEQQRMRKQIAAEYGDDGDYEAGLMDDDNVHNDDDDDDLPTNTVNLSPVVGTSSTSVQANIRKQNDHGTSTITMKHDVLDKPPTIIVKDSPNSKMNHTKIISEVLRQYPHLIKGNKNIKVKIVPNTGGNSQKIIVKKDTEKEKLNVQSSKLTTYRKVSSTLPSQDSVRSGRLEISSSSGTSISSANNKVITKSSTISPATTTTTVTGTTTMAKSQKRRIDSKTMHSLIAMGAENTTGPWLCLRCGRNGHPISIPSYRGFRRHLINTHGETIDPALCDQCGWRSKSKRELHFHIQIEHKVRSNLYIFPECQVCNQICLDSDALNQHLFDSHPEENKQQCIYCNKIFPEEMQLYTHMKSFHKKQALEDGIMDYSDDEVGEDFLNQLVQNEDRGEEAERSSTVEEKKIKILSDISLPRADSIMDLEQHTPNASTVSNTSLTSNPLNDSIYMSSDNETKFVSADGTEMILTDEQRKEILSQLNQEHEVGGVVMVLNEPQVDNFINDETSQATSTTNDETEHDDSQIYNEMKSQSSGMEDADEQEDQENSAEEEINKSGELDESKESIDNLEWAENLVSEHEMANEAINIDSTTANDEFSEREHVDEVKNEQKVNQKKSKIDGKIQHASSKSSEDEISKKLKELTGDWSDDDGEDDNDDDIGNDNNDGEDTNADIADEEDVFGYEKFREGEEERKTSDPERGNVTKKVDNEVDESDEESKHDSTDENKNNSIVDQKNIEKIRVTKDEPDDADDIDMALKTLHKEDDEIDIENVQIKSPKSDTEEVLETKVKSENNEILEGEEFIAENDNLNKNVRDIDDKEDKSSIELDDTANQIRTDDIKNDDDLKNSHSDNDDDVTSNEENAANIFTTSVENKSKTLKDEKLILKTRVDLGKTATSLKDTNRKVTNEERVKNLISEWGDDEDEVASEHDLSKNL